MHRGELNVGQLVRERHGRDAVSVGFTTPAPSPPSPSGAPRPSGKRVRPALPASYEGLFQDTRLGSLLLALREGGDAVAEGLCEPRLDRAIGVIHLPETERTSHYFHARLTDQFVVVAHFDDTRAVEPLERSAEWDRGEVPETYPFGV